MKFFDSKSGFARRDVLAMVILFVIVGAFMLPLVQVAKWVGSADLEVVFQVTNSNGEPVKQTAITLTELVEGDSQVANRLELRTDSDGRASHAFGRVTTTGSEDIFGRETDYNVSLPWWDVAAGKPDVIKSKPTPLPILAKDAGARAEYLGARKARIVIPIRLQQP